jgi:hypothetical protein
MNVKTAKLISKLDEVGLYVKALIGFPFGSTPPEVINIHVVGAI